MDSKERIIIETAMKLIRGHGERAANLLREAVASIVAADEVMRVAEQELAKLEEEK